MLEKEDNLLLQTHKEPVESQTASHVSPAIHVPLRDITMSQCWTNGKSGGRKREIERTEVERGVRKRKMERTEVERGGRKRETERTEGMLVK